MGFHQLDFMAAGVHLIAQFLDLELQAGILVPEVIALRGHRPERVAGGGGWGRFRAAGHEPRAVQNIDPALKTLEFCLKFRVFGPEKRHVRLHLGRRKPGLERGGVVELALHGPKGQLGIAEQMIVRNRRAIDKSEIGRSQIMEPVMAVHENKLRVVRRNAAIDDLNGIIRPAPDGNTVSTQFVSDGAGLWMVDAKGGHGRRSGRGRDSIIEIAKAMPCFAQPLANTDDLRKGGHPFP